MRRRRGDEEHENHERWLITYADLITLLLAFFIMMYVFSKKDTQRYEEVAGHLKTIFTGGGSVSGRAGASGPVPFELPVKVNRDVSEELQKKLEKAMGTLPANEAFQKNISIFTDERGVVIRILDKAFFDEGKADLRDRAKSVLNKIVPVIGSVNNQIRIEGHTDNIPINTREYRSNWELSVRRATEVVRHFVERRDFPPTRLSAVGYAEHRPVVPNDSAENRALNRRIEIIVIKSANDIKIEPIGLKPGYR